MILKFGAHTAMTSLEKSVTAEKTALKKSLDIKVKVVEDLKVVENSRYEVREKLFKTMLMHKMQQLNPIMQKSSW